MTPEERIARLEAENAALRRELDRAAGAPGAWTRADAEALESEPPPSHDYRWEWGPKAEDPK